MNQFAPGVPSQLGLDLYALSAKVGRRGDRLRELIERRAPVSVIRLELKSLAEAAAGLNETLFGASAEDLMERK